MENATLSVIKSVGTWAVIALLGYTLASTQDRYTATTAQYDLAKIRAEITLVENRITEVITRHEVGGPHDTVAERLAVNEARYETLLSEVREIKSMLRDNGK